MKDDKQDVTIHIAISLPIKEAETLAEFLSDLINKTMDKEAIVSFTIDERADELRRIRKWLEMTQGDYDEP